MLPTELDAFRWWRPSLVGWRPLLLGGVLYTLKLELRVPVEVSPQHDLHVCPHSQVQTYQVVPTQDMGEALWQSVESARGFLSPPKIVATWTPKEAVASLLLVAMPGTPSSVLAPSSKARSP